MNCWLLAGAAGVISIGLCLTGCGILISTGALAGLLVLIYFLFPRKTVEVDPTGKAVFITGRSTQDIIAYWYTRNYTGLSWTKHID